MAEQREMVVNNHQNLRIAGQYFAYCPGAGFAEATAGRIVRARGNNDRPGAVAQRLFRAPGCMPSPSTGTGEGLKPA